MDNANIIPFVTSNEDYANQVRSKAMSEGPTFFKLAARLPKQGRTDTIMAASNSMTVILKTYAQGGENGLHRHPNEDHVFVVLQGSATFYGPKGEMRRAMKHEGVFVPRTAYYWFKADGDEPLVMLRVGSAVDPKVDVNARIDIEGREMDGFSAENKEVEVILDNKAVFG